MSSSRSYPKTLYCKAHGAVSIFYKDTEQETNNSKHKVLPVLSPTVQESYHFQLMKDLHSSDALKWCERHIAQRMMDFCLPTLHPSRASPFSWVSE